MFPFEVDPTSDLPLWVQLRNRIAYLINDGTLAPGDKLPTVRGLASEISINYNTVNKAYLSLVSDGYLESTRGRGVFVTDLGAKMGAEGEGEADAVLDECIASCRELGMGLDDIERAMSRKIKRLKYDEARERGEVSARIIDFEKPAVRAERAWQLASPCVSDARMTPSRKSRSKEFPCSARRSLPTSAGFRVAPDASTELVGERASSAGVLLFSAVLFVAVLGLRCWASARLRPAA